MNRYKVIAISIYHDDLARADRMVRELRRRGDSSANRSKLIRQALNAYQHTISAGGAPDTDVDGEGSR